MPTAEEILGLNFASTRFKDLTIDAVLTTSDPYPDRKTVHILSKRDDLKKTFNVMGRVEGKPPVRSSLIYQTFTDPITNIQLWLKLNADRPRRLPFVAWEALPGTEMRNVDQVLLLNGFTAAMSPAGTMPEGPGAAPEVACWLVDLQLLPPGLGGPSPDRMRLWIEQSPTKALDHRIEQYRGADLLRVIVSEDWRQPAAGSPWAAKKRTFIDAASGRASTLDMHWPPNTKSLLPGIFSIVNFSTGMW